MFEQVVSAARWTIVHFVLAEIQGGEREGKKAEFPLQKDKKCRCNWDIWECLVSGSRGEMKPVRLERLTDSKASPLRLTFSLASPSSPLCLSSHSIPSLAFPSSLSVSEQATDLACEARQPSPSTRE